MNPAGCTCILDLLCGRQLSTQPHDAVRSRLPQDVSVGDVLSLHNTHPDGPLNTDMEM